MDYLVTLVTVAALETFSKTPLIALLLAAWFRRPGAVLAGVVAAAAASSAVSFFVGLDYSAMLPSRVLAWAAGVTLVTLAGLMLGFSRAGPSRERGRGPLVGLLAFTAALLAVFTVRMFDHVPLTMAALSRDEWGLAATCAMWLVAPLIASAPAVWLGGWSASRLTAKWTAVRVQRAAASGMGALGALVLLAGRLPG